MSCREIGRALEMNHNAGLHRPNATDGRPSLMSKGVFVSMSSNDDAPQRTEYLGLYENGAIRLSARVNWPDGTPVLVRAAELTKEDAVEHLGHVIVAGFGLAGRWIADIFDRHGVPYVVVEKNLKTVEAQRKLRRKVIEGDIADEATLREAGIEDAAILALTIPDEEAVLAATKLARSIKPEIYIVARTLYSSSGLQATQLGADEVIKAEQVVARQFYEMLLRKIMGRSDNEKKPNPSQS
jgi:voltage-gated potassium channel Kch